jgi:hypothetical protein
MTDSAAGAAVGARDRLSAVLRGRAPLWAAFVAVHLALGVICLTHPSLPMGDVTIVYRAWARDALVDGTIVGIDVPWVYPAAAFVPMLLAAIGGLGSGYASAWLVVVLLADAAALAALTGVTGPRRNLAAGWWWVTAIAALGPVAVGRIDAIAAAIAVAGVAVLGRSRVAAVVLFTIGAWVKIWPAALVGAFVVASRTRGRLIATAVVTSVLVVLVPLLWGGLTALGFVTTQTGRGLQIEAPVTTPWMWAAAFGDAVRVYYDTEILTYQVQGPGVELASAVMTPLLVVVALAVVLVGVRAARRGVDEAVLAPWLALALVTTMIGVNKVGSPQFASWLVGPVVLGLVLLGRRFHGVAVAALVLSLLTQMIYPYRYDLVVLTDPAMLVVLTLRNAAWFVLLGWAVVAMWKLGSRRGPSIPDAVPAAAESETPR